MTINTIILINFIYAIVLWYVLSAIFLDQKNKLPLNLKSGEKELDDLNIRKEEVLISLKDLELDYKTHKISEEEYGRAKQAGFNQGVELVKKIEILKNKKSTLPKTKEITSSSRAEFQPKFCTNCGAPRQPQAQFCGQCGKKLES